MAVTSGRGHTGIAALSAKRGYRFSSRKRDQSSYSASPGFCPVHSPTRRIMIRIEDECFGRHIVASIR
jgi:hypothetical protein